MSTQLTPKDPKRKEYLLEGRNPSRSLVFDFISYKILGQKYAEEGVKLDVSSFSAVKWAAVVTGALSGLMPTKEKIELGYVFKVGAE
jgi:hypothetical protein